jgi:hypothetical protein
MCVCVWGGGGASRRCYAAAVEGAEAEHAARRRLITRVLQDIHACLEVSAVHRVPG